MMCQTEGETCQTDEEMPSASKVTPSDSGNGATTRQHVIREIVQTLSARFDSVPRIFLWI